MTRALPASVKQPTSCAMPDLEDHALDAVCHMRAALDVLELHARHRITAINCVCRDLLRVYYAQAVQAKTLGPDALCGMSLQLGHAIEVLEMLNDDEADDPILYAVSYLLRASRRLADEGVSARL
ncbi:hypothetical protein [Delftia sp. PS-11]|uniref:hypothetical protein n=1 Tax=Delftia sp. PS-11 TaxID=2767222 RepID=UPI003AB1D21B